MNQTIFDTSEICFQLGVRHAVFSPGSRNAPLSISFHRNKKIEKYVIVDERSAGFMALGIAQETKRPIVLCCTSGTALLNYGPAIAEAFYQQIPLIVLSADRPPEWIDQWDGQTIRQQDIFGSFTKYFAQMPVDLSHPDAQWEYQRKLSQAIAEATSGTPGPVHINIPFREPFYPDKELSFSSGESLKFFRNSTTTPTLSVKEKNELSKAWGEANRKLIVLGHHEPWDDLFLKNINKISEEQQIPIVSDFTSNGHVIEAAVLHHDLFLSNTACWENLMPDLIIYMGKSLISKNLKTFLRNAQTPLWQVGNGTTFADPLQSMRINIGVDEIGFLETVQALTAQKATFLENWLKEDLTISRRIFKEALPFSEVAVFREVMEALPDEIDLHLANSMPVRYANFFQTKNDSIRVFSNRGTSGIDGTNSTAVGNALVTQRKVVLLTGDLSFLYDRNAFFHDYDISNLYVIVFNNFGGGIFDLIPGPVSLPEDEREAHFTTPHGKDMKKTADDAGFAYFKANDEITLELALASFFEAGNKARLLEIQTNSKINQQTFKQFKALAL